MKQLLIYISFLALIIGAVSSCHNIEVPITTELTPNIFPLDSVQFIQASGPVYAGLRGSYSVDYFFINSQSTDEAIMPAYGGNWYDNQNYRMLHYHSWTKDHGFTNSCWGYLATLIGTTNQTLKILGLNEPEGTAKKTNLSELKMVRAIGYFMMMDLYGNVPIDTLYGDFAPRANSTRSQVFNFIESEVKGAIPNLSEVTGITTYGRATKHTAYALLAKMYLNAEYYTGSKRYDDCINACDKIINSGKFGIEPMNTYLQMFYPNNGPLMKEFVFAIPYDPTYVALPGTNGFNYHARYDVPRSEGPKFGLPFTPNGPEATLPEFYANFNDPNDIRNKQWLTGLQYLNDGVTPVMVTTTKLGYDQFYTGPDGSAPYTYQVNITPNIVLRQNPALFDVGNDEIAWNSGYRNIKFYPDKTSTNRNQNNDVPVFRYSDIILMKAEAILRGGNATLADSPLSLVNLLRSNRTTSPALSDVTLDDIYTERCREFAWEAWHRNDMIRFGKFEGNWGFKTDSDPNHRILPIPTSAMVLNPALKQNPGY